MLGQKIILGFHGTELPEQFVALIREYQIGNVILFQRNVESAEQLRRLCGEIRSVIMDACGILPFIVIDQEGGMVSRLPADAVNIPSAMALGATADPVNGTVCAKITARQLRGLGPNFNMAPVLDVNTNANNPVIGVRSYGDDPHKVGKFAEAVVKGYMNTGIFCCGKHFPGHGDTAVDSHLGLPVVEKTLDELEKAELIPFRRAIDAGIPAIMSSHILFPQIEKERIPCTMSRTIITDLLKRKLGFKGLVFSDCLEMQAIQKFYGTAIGMASAFKAGVDLAEISSTFALEQEAVAYVNEAAQNGEFDLQEIRESAEKIIAYKKYLEGCEIREESCNRPEDRAIVKKMAEKAVSCYSGKAFTVDKGTFYCGCADYRTTNAANKEAAVEPFAEFMQKHLGGGCLVTDKNPDEDQILAAVKAAKSWDSIVLATCNAHLFRGQLQLAEALAALGKPMMIAATRNPYDLPMLPDCACRISVFDYTEDAFEALFKVFQGGEMMGHIPVML